jgi:hypothetical protein
LLRRGFAKTDLMDINDDASVVEEQLNVMLALENARCRVTTPSPFLLHIEFLGDLSGVDIDPLEVEVASAPPGDWTFDLDLNKYRTIRMYHSGADNLYWGYLTDRHVIEVTMTEPNLLTYTTEGVRLRDILCTAERIKSITVKYDTQIVMHEYLED